MHSALPCACRWQLVGTTSLSSGQANYISLAFTTTGTPYVAFGGGENGGKATVMKYAVHD